MQSKESCTLCEKVVVAIDSALPLESLNDLPNTFDAPRGQFVWRRYGSLSYAMVPRAVDGSRGRIDLYLCLDEDVLDDINLLEFTDKFLRDAVFINWKGIRSASLVQPNLSPPTDLVCWKLQQTNAAVTPLSSPTLLNNQPPTENRPTVSTPQSEGNSQ